MGRAIALTATAACVLALLANSGIAAHRGGVDGEAACASVQKTPAKPAPLPPRRAIAGIQLLETTSTVTFTVAPDRRHELVSTFAFPGRARLQLTLQDEQTKRRTLRYVHGERAFALDAGAQSSRELAGLDLDEALAEVELRRAAFLWPDGFDWKASGTERGAPAGALGSLRAHMAEGARAPDEIELLDASGTRRLALRGIQWAEHSGRAWPSAFEVWRGDARVATETVTARDTTRAYVDSYFLPVDRRDGSTEHDAMIGIVRSQDLPRFCARRVPLAGVATWSEARARIEALRTEWTATLARQSLALDPSWTVELDEQARPAALLVRTTTVPATAPEGFEISAVRQARVMFVKALEEASGDRLAELKRAVPPQAKLHAAYVRYRPQDGQVLLVLPIAP